MADWFRSWHGAPTDPKWIAIARRASTNAATVSAIAWALFDHASQAEPRGSVTGFDAEVYAAFAGLDDDVVRAAIEAMSAKGMIGGDGQLTNWKKRQPEREDGAAERSRAWRERKKPQPNDIDTSPNATERNRTQPNDTDTEQKIETEEEDTRRASSSAADSNETPKVERRKTEDESWMADVGGEWNAMASRHKLPQVNDIHTGRQSVLRQRRKDLVDLGHDDPLEGFGWFFNKIRGSPFLRGDRGRSPATFDWVLSRANFHKIVDGNYEAEFKTSGQPQYPN